MQETDRHIISALNCTTAVLLSMPVRPVCRFVYGAFSLARGHNSAIILVT